MRLHHAECGLLGEIDNGGTVLYNKMLSKQHHDLVSALRQRRG